MTTVFMFVLDFLAWWQVWWGHRVAKITALRTEVLKTYIVSIVKYDLETCDRETWYKLSWLDVMCIMINKYAFDCFDKSMLLEEFYAPSGPNVVFEIIMGDGTVALTRDTYVHNTDTDANANADADGDADTRVSVGGICKAKANADADADTRVSVGGICKAKANDDGVKSKHTYIYCMFDNCLNVTDYINQRWRSFDAKLGVTAKDMLTIINLEKFGKRSIMPRRRSAAVNKTLLRVMHGTTLEMQTFIEDDVVVLN